MYTLPKPNAGPGETSTSMSTRYGPTSVAVTEAVTNVIRHAYTPENTAGLRVEAAFDDEALRMLVGQEIGLRWTVPLALRRVEVEPLLDAGPGSLRAEQLPRGTLEAVVFGGDQSNERHHNNVDNVEHKRRI